MCFDSHEQHFDLNLALLRDLFTSNATIHHSGQFHQPRHVAYQAINLPESNDIGRVTMLSHDDFELLLRVGDHTFITRPAELHWNDLTLTLASPKLILSRTSLDAEESNLRNRLRLTRMNQCPAQVQEMSIQSRK